VPVAAPLDPIVEFTVPLELLLTGGRIVPVVSGFVAFSALLEPEWSAPFVPVLAPLEPIVEFTVPLALWAEAADAIPRAKPVARMQALICFLNMVASCHGTNSQDCRIGFLITQERTYNQDAQRVFRSKILHYEVKGSPKEGNANKLSLTRRLQIFCHKLRELN
jgi:hypothetical protein